MALRKKNYSSKLADLRTNLLYDITEKIKKSEDYKIKFRIEFGSDYFSKGFKSIGFAWGYPNTRDIVLYDENGNHFSLGSCPTDEIVDVYHLIF